MKINNINNKNLYNNIPKTIEDKQQNIDSKAAKHVNIEISQSAKLIAKEIEESQDANFSQKVEGIRKAILDGSYKVSSEEIADKILRAIEIQKGSDL